MRQLYSNTNQNKSFPGKMQNLNEMEIDFKAEAISDQRIPMDAVSVSKNPMTDFKNKRKAEWEEVLKLTTKPLFIIPTKNRK